MSTNPLPRSSRQGEVVEIKNPAEVAARTPAPEWIVPLARLLFAAIFLAAAPGHFSAGTIAYAAKAGVPAPSILVPISGALALIGGLSILLGFRARAGAWLLVLFLVPVTFWMHRFWGLSDPAAAQMQQVNFMKNVAMLGGALLVAYFGAGPFSFDARRRR
ncbi:MAG TPA: DoxX family protein [candidate division Zixibacteria bacterium]|nr:DoxX family protein [candidate division Zixibacteria bacterium]